LGLIALAIVHVFPASRLSSMGFARLTGYVIAEVLLMAGELFLIAFFIGLSSILEAYPLCFYCYFFCFYPDCES
jgi:hypothetical protein